MRFVLGSRLNSEILRERGIYDSILVSLQERRSRKANSSTWPNIVTRFFTAIR